MKNFVTLLLIVFACESCLSPAPVHLRVHEDHVYAETTEVAEEVAERLQLGRSRLLADLPDMNPGGVEVWALPTFPTIVMESGEAPHVFENAFTVRAPGELSRIYVKPGSFRDVLQHELVHALLGESWMPLPLSMEEGLCSQMNNDYARTELTLLHLSCAARGGGGTHYAVSVNLRELTGEITESSLWWAFGGGTDASDSQLSLEEILSVSTSSELYEMTPGEIGHLYGVGYVLVGRIAELHGLEALHALCVRATANGHEWIPIEWILDSAQVDDRDHLEQLARETLSRLGLKATLDDGDLMTPLRIALKDSELVSLDDPNEFLSRFEGTLQVNGEPIDLGGSPAFRDWLREHWSELREFPSE